MADDSVGHHDLGEVWGKVQNLEGNFKSLAGQVESGFNRVFEAINSNTEKTERRISEYQRETNARFETEANTNRQSTANRSATALQIIGYLLTAFIGLGGLVGSFVGLAVTFYTLTKAPIDQSFARLDAGNAANSAAITTLQTQQAAALDKTRDRFEEASKDFDKKLENYVPAGEVNKTIAPLVTTQATNSAKIATLETAAAISVTDRAAIHETVAGLAKEIDRQRETFRTEVVSRNENENRFSDVQYRINSLFERLNIVQNDLASGNKVGDRINRLADQVETLTNKFVVIPPKPSPLVEQESLKH